MTLWYSAPRRFSFRPVWCIFASRVFGWFNLALRASQVSESWSIPLRVISYPSLAHFFLMVSVGRATSWVSSEVFWVMLSAR